MQVSARLGGWTTASTLAAACEAAGGTTLLATGDRDSLQLGGRCYDRSAGDQQGDYPLADPAAIREKYGIEPPQLIDESLMGDLSDNIPGAAGHRRKPRWR